ncbi:MAG: 16S rRNA (adenine(1518)-N(6)/adenine(1519)-N(6))-dimethyltransferase RsmA [Methanothrix sp.]|nr:16S rRNA (adenine(1518)-N(6)/adenine(1519)-N(6))-dimethyltransferase RsmA [Methanothrix sp.]
MRIASYADLQPQDRVLEIGPGPGNLTEALAARAGHVYAVEIDGDMATQLSGRFSNVQVINEDALKAQLPPYNKIVSNLPYQISSAITYRLLSRSFETAILMYQWEFARRMTAAPGSEEYGRLAMTVGFFCRIDILEKVSKMAFRPVPQVDSAIVRLQPRLDRPEADPVDFLRLAEGLFNNRRKKVKKGLAALGASPRAIAELDASLLERRPENLSPDEAASLVVAISRKSRS